MSGPPEGPPDRPQPDRSHFEITELASTDLDSTDLDSTELDSTELTSTVSAMLADAGEIALRYFRTAIVADDKSTAKYTAQYTAKSTAQYTAENTEHLTNDPGQHGFDPVTEADRGIEDLLRARIHDRFGVAHQVLGEERGLSGSPGRFRWLIDPIDGTKSFVTGSPLWGILLGLLDRRSAQRPEDPGKPVAGWMHQPYIGETFAGFTGDLGSHDGRRDELAAWIERDGVRTPLATRSRTSIAEAHLYTTSPGMFSEADERAAFDRLSSTVQLTRFGGDCYAYCLLAMGQIDLVVEAGLQPYDIVALIPIVEAAGGVVTGRHGESAAGGGFVVASANEHIHEQALAVLNQESS